MITIIADRYCYERPPSGALLATRTGEYVTVRRRVREALDHNEPLVVYATDPVLLHWLADLQRYPDSRVTWRVVDPAEEFMRFFGVSPTPPFTAARIAALKLQELPPVAAGMFVEPLSWILGHRLHPVWQHDELAAGHAIALAEWAIQQTQPLETNLLALAQAQLERWSTDAPIYRAFHAASIAQDSAKLLVRWALRWYNGNWRGVQTWSNAPLLAIEPSPAAVVQALHSERTAIQTYWNRQIVSASVNAARIQAAVAEMSGLSQAELEALELMVKRCPAALDNSLLETIQNRFAQLPNAERTLHRIAGLIVPPKPSLPDPAWSTEHWLRWVTQHYMPYFTWLIQRGGERDHQQACALAYSDWLYNQYPSWLNDQQSPLLLRQYQHMHALLEGDDQAVVVWLVVDGMTWWQGQIMVEMCQRHGLHVQAQQVGIAVLPSITSVSKRALVTGQPTIDLAQPTIAEAARLKLARSNISAVVSYDLAVATETLCRDEHMRVALVLFNMIDVLAHQTSSFTDNLGIRGYLEIVATQLQSVQQACAEQGRRLHVLIGSDHGSTLLPPEAHSLPLPNRVREIDDVWEPELPDREAQKPGTRAAATDLDQVPHVDRQTWYALDRDRFQLDRHYLVPRGYNYIKRRPVAWTHGGLTPEETIVPLLHLAAEQPRLLPLEIEFAGTLNVGQAGTIIVVLRNLNPFPVQELALAVEGATTTGALLLLGSLEQQQIELEFAPVQTPGTELQSTYQVSYNAFGTIRRDTGQARIALRRLQTEDRSFDDMFN